MQLRLVTYNIHKGFRLSPFGSHAGAFLLPQMREALHALEPDLIFLQEVLGDHETYKAWPHWPKPEPHVYMQSSRLEHSAYGKNAIYSAGHHGNAILSRFPFRSFENINLSFTRFEKRGLLHAEMVLPDQKIVHVFCTHLNLLEASRLKQFELIKKRIRDTVDASSPMILAGDFNDWTETLLQKAQVDLGLTEVLQTGSQHSRRSFPSFYPLLSLDRIFVRHFDVKTAEVLRSKPWSGLSDHLPLTAQLYLK